MKKVIMVLGLTLAASAQAVTYTCSGMGSAKGSQVLLQIVNEREVRVGQNLAELDTKFSPRGNVDLSRFEYEESDEGTQEVLVQNALLEGADKGLIKIQWRGEAFATQSYYCHP